MRKLSAVCAVVLAIISLFFLPASGETPETEFEWRFTGDTVEVKAYTGDGGDVVIPSSYQGSPVTSIGEAAFAECDTVSRVTIPDSVESIGKYAFRGCSMTAVKIPDSVMQIGIQAFFRCPNLTGVRIPNGLANLERGTFSSCKSLAWVEIPSSVTRIGSDVFNGCSSLTSLFVPGSVESIGDNAFYGCTSLAHAVLDNGIVTLGEYTFYECSNLLGIALPASITKIGSGSFHACPQVTLYVTQGSPAQTFAEEGNHSFRFSNPLVPSRISSDRFAIKGGQIFPKAGLTASQLKESIQGGEYVKVLRGTSEISGGEPVGTGMTLQLMDRALVKQSVDVVITGEIDGDGMISAADALLTLQAATGKLALSSAQEQAARVGGQSTVLASDALLILQLATQKIQEFPSAA